jgi:hypothetical protein
MTPNLQKWTDSDYEDDSSQSQKHKRYSVSCRFSDSRYFVSLLWQTMSIWQGVAMGSLKDLPCPTLLRPFQPIQRWHTCRAPWAIMTLLIRYFYVPKFYFFMLNVFKYVLPKLCEALQNIVTIFEPLTIRELTQTCLDFYRFHHPISISK